MRKSTKIGIVLLIAVVSAGGITLAYFTYRGDFCLIPENCPPLEFPVAGGALNITGFNGFNVSNWGAPGSFHNGIDLVTTGHNWTGLVACAPGQAISVAQSQNPYSNPPNAITFSISIRIACGWVVEYAIEPAAYQEYQGALQQQQIYVKAGDQVQTGTLIARLLCTDVTYNHLHLFLHHGGSGTFLCAYEYSSAAAKATYDQIAATYGKTVCCSLSGQPGCS